MGEIKGKLYGTIDVHIHLNWPKCDMTKQR